MCFILMSESGMGNLRIVFFIGKMVGGPWDGGPLAVYPPKEPWGLGPNRYPRDIGCIWVFPKIGVGPANHPF